jgi:hypothetical protein
MAISTIQFSPLGTITQSMGAELNSLPSTGIAVAPNAYDNTVSRHTHLLVEVFAGLISAPPANATIDVYLCPSLDGVNFDMGASGLFIPSGALLVATFGPKDAAQRIYVARAELPGPCLIKPVLVNATGRTFLATANTLKLRPFANEIV